MPTPKDHRETTVVVQTPTTSRQVVYELSFVRNTDGKVFEEVKTDTPDTDETFRELQVFDNGNLVLDVRAHLTTKVHLQPNQTATKTVVSQPEPPLAGTNPQHPLPTAPRHVWVAAGLEVTLELEATTDLGPAVVEVQWSVAGEWRLVVKRAAAGPEVAHGRLTLPSDVVKL